MYDLLNSHFLVQALPVAATLGLADLLADGPRSVDDLASTTQTHVTSLHRLLRMLAGNGVFAEDEHGRFGLTRLAALLNSDAPDSVRDWALFVGAPPVWAAWGNLAAASEQVSRRSRQQRGCRCSCIWRSIPTSLRPTTAG